MSGASLRALHDQGKQALRARNIPQALGLLKRAALKTSARENDYRAVLEDLRTALVSANVPRAALTVHWYLGDRQAAYRILDSVPPIDQARTLQWWADTSEDRNKAIEHYVGAAARYESCGMLAHAAICHEKTHAFDKAKVLWSRLSLRLAGAGGEQYAAGLARFNLSRACNELGEPAASRSAMISAVHLLEEAADHYERVGQRERAFDCYQVLVAIGKQTSELEHVLEGYVNIVRILREDNLSYYALQNYEEVLQQVLKRKEFAAGASLAQEMASYAKAQGMAEVANHGTQLQAKMWQQMAVSALERGSPVEVAENAMLAAVVAYARQGQFSEVGKLYEGLAQLDLEPSRKQHYARASKRYDGKENAQVQAAPLAAHLRQEDDFPEVWHVDLIEWEQAGSAAAACADVVLDSNSWTEVTRRRALVARMQALSVEGKEGAGNREECERLVKMLGQIELYSILSPLEHYYKSSFPQVRHAVIESLERFMYKRSFITLRTALADPESLVRKRAYRTIEALRFPHAFDPLARIVRESDDTAARVAAIRAVARIDTVQAAELTLGIYQHHGKAERKAATEALKRSRGRHFLEVARASAASLDKGVRNELHEVFRARGERLR